MAVAIACFVAAFFLASLVEYWMHRLMHFKPASVGKVHVEHHRRGDGQGVIWEFLAYVKGTCIIIFPMFFVSVQAGVGWTAGAVLYAAFSAYAHQLQHENPTKCFWMKMPVHYVHHKYGQWHHNFGLAVDWWDHVFGTYKPTDWLTEEELQRPDLNYLQLRWW